MDTCCDRLIDGERRFVLKARRFFFQTIAWVEVDEEMLWPEDGPRVEEAGFEEVRQKVLTELAEYTPQRACELLTNSISADDLKWTCIRDTGIAEEGQLPDPEEE